MAGRSADGGFAAHLVHDSWFGKKTIGFAASVALIVNNVTGPGVPSLANMFAEAGWLFPCCVFVAVFVLTNLSTAMYCEAMRKIPSNEHFRGRIEYTSIVEYYFGHRAYIAAQIGLNGALQSLNIVGVIQSAQVMDNAISAIFGHTCGVNITPFANYVGNHTELHESTKGWSCVNTNDVGAGNPWGCHVVLTMGYLTAMLITVPMGYFNLDDNMIVQVVSFILTVGCWGMWLVACFFSDAFATPSGWYLPAVNTGNAWSSQAAVIGTVLFNFALVTTIPSWVNEKKPEVSINKTVWLSTMMALFFFFIMGIPGAMAFQKYLAGPATNECADPSLGGCAQSLMNVFTTKAMVPRALKHGAANWVLQTSVYLFPPCAVMSSIPVFSIIIKYNCVENGFSHKFAFVWGVLFPWIVALPLLYQPDALNQFITYSSLIFVSFTDFIVPWALYIVLQRKEAALVQRGIDPEALFALPSSSYNIQGEETPLLSSTKLTDADVRAVKEPVIVEHFAIPPSWGISHSAKTKVSLILVFVMGAAAAAGTILQIMTTSSTTWDCALP